jgi:hypothetical protein
VSIMAKYRITTDENGNHYVIESKSGDLVDGPYNSYVQAKQAALKDPLKEKLLDD